MQLLPAIRRRVSPIADEIISAAYADAKISLTTGRDDPANSMAGPLAQSSTASTHCYKL